MKTFITLAFGVANAIAFAASAVTAAEPSTNVLTAESIVHEVGFRSVKTPYLLAFKSEVDNRPLYLESALLAIECATNEWYLVHVYRQPKEQVEHFHHWKVSAVTDVPYTGQRYYDHRPSEGDVDNFLHDTWWKFRARPDFRLIRGEVYSETWQSAFGYRPTHEFPKPSP
jgi:hypothetical protein